MAIYRLNDLICCCYILRKLNYQPLHSILSEDTRPTKCATEITLYLCLIAIVNWYIHEWSATEITSCFYSVFGTDLFYMQLYMLKLSYFYILQLYIKDNAIIKSHCLSK